MRSVLITNARIITTDAVVDGSLLISDGKIAAVATTENVSPDAVIIDAKGDLVAPGFVEIHVHGGGGADFMDLTPEAFDAVTKTHRAHGTTTLMPTTVACSFDKLCELFELYRKVKETACVHFAGLHLEGPYISNEQRGAQNPSFVRNPEKSEVDALLAAGGDVIKMCTAAPELEGADYLASEMLKRGIIMSVGHSDAVYEDMERAYEMGFRHVTHMYSNTPTVRKIEQVLHAGVREAAYLFEDMGIELIGDGCHLPKEVLRLALKVKGADRINITSDAMRAAGTDVSESYLGEQIPENRVIIENGVAKLPDRSFFAGSIATGDVMLKWLHNTCKVDLPTAVRLLSLSPARVIGMDFTKGSIETGKDADLIFLDSDLNVKKTFLCTELTRLGK